MIYCYRLYIQITPSRSLGVRQLNTLTRKIPYRRILRWIIVVEMH